MKAFLSSHPILAAACASLLLGLAYSAGFAPLELHWVSLAALALLFYVLSRCERVRTAAAAGFAFGMGWFVPGLSWCVAVMTDHARLPLAAAVAGLLALAAAASLFPAAALALAKYFNRGDRVRTVLSAAGLITLFEWLRAAAVQFGWLAPGYALLDTPFAGYAPLAGINGVTLAGTLFAALAACTLAVRPKFAAVPAAFAAVILLGGQAAGTAVWSHPSKTVDVRIVQPDLPVVDAFTRYSTAARIRALFDLAAAPWPDAQKPRILLTPEGVVTQPVERLGAQAAGALFELQEKADAPVLFNGFRQEGRRFYNTSFVLGEGQIVYRIDKRALVPFGEFVPEGFRWLIDLIGIPMTDLAEGDAVQPMLDIGGVSAGILICYENLSGEVMRSYWQSRSPDFLIVTSSLGWFSDSILPQFLDIARMRALESARPVVSVSNSGMSAVISSRGEVVRRLGVHERAELTLGLLGATGEATPYVRFSGWPSLFLAFLLAACGFFSPRRLQLLREMGRGEQEGHG
jgi:apolipoprotein N-acyltransferase